MKTAALVFSGGALRGFAQLGAYKAIETFLKKKNIIVKTVVGTSFGSITASLVALGYTSTEMVAFAKENKLKMSNMADIKIIGPGFLRGNRVKKELRKAIGDKTFQDTKIKLVINTVDLLSGKEYIFTPVGLKASDHSEVIKDKEIKILDAIRASTAIPAVFMPLEKYGRIWVDGGLVNPMCLDTLDKRKYDYIIGVDVSMANFNFIDDKDERIRKVQVMQQAISIAQRQFHFEKVEEHMQKHKNFYLIRPPVGPVRPKRKGEMQRILNVGYKEAKKVLDV
ncbi:MAG: patatin-like phospholipase family protein [Nanoarchaeota archaeon]